MSGLLYTYKKKGFPIIKIYPTYIEIKAIDYWEFRRFNYSDIKQIKYYDPNNNWYTKLALTFSSLITRIMAEKKYRYLRVIKHNDGYWNYNLPGTIDEELLDVLQEIEKCIQNTNT